MIYRQIMYISKVLNVQCNSKISEAEFLAKIFPVFTFIEKLRLLCTYYMRRQLMSRNIL